jgi:chemotaxis family two-component system sensor histidine kinase/response regulator PixL
MSINSEIRDQAYQFFIEEAPELLQIIEAGLLTLKDERSTAKVHDLMRAAHSLKGGAASVGLNGIKTLAHRLEDYFKALYSDTIVIDQALESLLLQAYDCLKEPLMQQIATGAFDAEAALAIANPIFSQIEACLGDSLNSGEEYIPTSADLGIDLVASIFEVDVAQGLERLAAVIAQPQHYEVAGEVRAQAEVFAGFGELLNLPGFGAIAQQTLKALERHPDKVLEIAQLALADFQLSRERVLAGARTQGGCPSDALQAFCEVTVENPLLSLETLLSSAITSSEPDEVKLQETAISPPSLDDVFVLSDPLPSPLPATAEDAFLPALDEVFGNEKNEVTNGSALHTPNDDIDENLEAAIQAVEQIFDSLPALQELPNPVTAQEPISAAAAIPAGTKLRSNKVPREIEAVTRRGGDTEKEISSLTATPSAAPEPAKASTASNLSVRVDFNRLERMNNLVGELAINRNSLSLQNDQLQETVKELLNRFSRFQEMAGKLRELSDQMLVAPERYPHGNSPLLPTQAKELSLLQADFDSLELDSYGKLYSLLQGLLEDVIQLEESAEDLVLFARGSNQTLEQQRQMLTNLRDELMWARMLPLGEVLNRFPRVLRDLSTTYQKPVKLKLSGTGVLVDKAALEKLYDPLLHLLRNAFDHGIEPPQIRQQNGKPDEGNIEIRAYHQGNQTIIEVKDDGQGLNLEKIAQQAIKVGFVTPEQVAVMPKERLYDLIFQPGFSTASQVSELSGRGMGLDVVRSQLRLLKGTVTVICSPEQGTTFRLALPLTLTISKLLVCLVNQPQLNHLTALALPSDGIEEIIVPQADQIKHSGSQRFFHWQRQIIPIYRVHELLDYRCPAPETFSSKALAALPSPEDWGLPLLLLRSGQQLFALEVNRLVTEQELVIKPFSTTIAPPSYTYGCTILGDGTLIPVINGILLLEQFLQASPSPNAALANVRGLDTIVLPISSQTSTILVVDDSAALRRTLALTLEKADYRVLQARDGREALEQLQGGSKIHLVICDVEMPNMNGFEFLGQRRRDPQLTQIPVAMLTSRSSDKHRQLAMHLGATAYFTKPYIEQQFLRAVKNLIAQPAPDAIAVLS